MSDKRRTIDPELVEQLARDMFHALPKNFQDRLMHMDKERMPKRMKRELLETWLLGAVESPTYQKEVARALLEKPLEGLKHQVALIPKNVNIESEIKVQHTIVVPQMQTTEQWMEAQTVPTLDGGRAWKDEPGFEEAFAVKVLSDAD